MVSAAHLTVPIAVDRGPDGNGLVAHQRSGRLRLAR
jgi:hypothetical protein